ncbi:MAG: hypothetical protein R3F54_11715 [Alphaproteobacteria bacterium]
MSVLMRLTEEVLFGASWKERQKKSIISKNEIMSHFGPEDLFALLLSFAYVFIFFLLMYTDPNDSPLGRLEYWQYLVRAPIPIVLALMKSVFYFRVKSPIVAYWIGFIFMIVIFLSGAELALLGFGLKFG